MRRFRDLEGRTWDVVAGRESWGAFFAIFVPSVPDEGMRQTQLAADSWADAQRELEAADERFLGQLLARSAPKTLD